MLNQFGLHQFTNYTHYPEDWGGGPHDPQLENGLATWTEGGFGKPVSYHALFFSSMLQVAWTRPEGQGAGAEHSSSCCLLYSLTPIGEYADYWNTTIWLWNPLNASMWKLPLPKAGSFGVAGFDGEWGLLGQYDHSTSGATRLENGLWAINVHTLESRELLPQQPHPLGHYYSDRLQGQVVSNHSAFFSLVDTIASRHYSTLWEVNLNTGEKTAIMWRNNTLITDFDASPRYLVVPGPGVEHQSVWIMDRSNRTWWDLEKSPGAMVALPRVAGDWCIFLEQYPAMRKTELVGVHIPTGKKYSLIPSNRDMSMIKWDTDGQRVVVQLELELENSWAKYPGVQLYWMDLPKVQ